MIPEPGERFCKACDYPLAAEGMVACPECGRGFDAGDAKTYSGRPTARRRRWMRRGAVVLGVILLVQCLAPSRVVRLTWSWPNPDGKTATSETCWCLAAPRWLDVRYPRWTSARWTKQIESRGLEYQEQRSWRVGWAWISPDGGGNMWIPTSTLAMAYADDRDDPTGWRAVLDAMPGNLDELCDQVLRSNSGPVMSIEAGGTWFEGPVLAVPDRPLNPRPPGSGTPAGTR